MPTSNELDETELYSIFKSSPLLTESTKLILESTEGITVTEIGKQLHKTEPTVHGALRPLRDLSLVQIRPAGKNKIYSITPAMRNSIQNILVKLYLPTRSYVLGEMQVLIPPPTIEVIRDQLVLGKCFRHRIDLMYQYTDDSGEKYAIVAWVISNLTEHEILTSAGKVLDLQMVSKDWQGQTGFLFIVLEDRKGGTSRKLFSDLARFLKALDFSQPTTAILIEKKNPLRGINLAKNWVKKPH
jgi:DNA-binding transcriptional ArsR family regulator